MSVLIAVLAAGCSRNQVQSAPRPGVPVKVATVEERTVPFEVQTIGYGEAYSTVSVKAQVSAELMQAHFHEGDYVSKGQLLFTLDRRPFDAALAQAKANLAHDKAQAENAKVETARYAKLYQEGVVSKEQNDQLKTSADAATALVAADEAAVENARLQLEYCFIYSPIDGRTGTLMVHVGNLTKANDVPVLVTINQINPIYVTFSPPETVLPEVKQRLAAGEKLKVRALLPTDPQHPETGVLTFVDNSVDYTSGTIKMKGTFANADRRLWPGEFVNVVLTLREQHNALVVPSQAVQAGQQGSFVFVVKPDSTVELRIVEVTRTFGQDAVIAKGLRAGETVITDGQFGLVTGSKVQVKGS
jgi:membrane fusion protein, multidrug efflux system